MCHSVYSRSVLFLAAQQHQHMGNIQFSRPTNLGDISYLLGRANQRDKLGQDIEILIF